MLKAPDADDVDRRLNPRLERSDLVQWFFPESRNHSLVGLEIECGLIRAHSGESVAYDEPLGSKVLLEALLDLLGGSPMVEGPTLVGVTLPDDSTITLEMAGAVEYSSMPTESLTECLAAARNRLIEVAQIASGMQITVLTGGHLPFESPAGIKWVPKPRTRIMREHFRRLGEGGRFGDNVMGTTLSTQLSLDARSPQEYLAKFRAMVGASPFIAALLVNTPSLQPRHNKYLSNRMLYWRKIDPARCQALTGRLWGASDLEELVSGLASVPMIYRSRGNDFVAALDRSFEQLIEDGFGDGSFPRLSDWVAHLGQVWPSVRPRRTLETRLPDGQAWANFCALPALYVGLVEEPDVRNRVNALVSDMSLDVLDSTTVVAAERGWHGLTSRAQEVSLELLELASEGLAGRISRGVESPALLESLDSVREVAETGVTFAEQAIQMWESECSRDPAKYVERLAVPAG